MILSLWSGAVLPDWLDYNGHMTEHRYLQVFGESSDALYARLGVDFADAVQGAYYTLETHIRHVAECRLGTRLQTETEILGHDDKRIHLLHRLRDEGGRLLATGEHLVLHVAHGKSAPAPAGMLERLAACYDADAPAPEDVGSVLRKPLAHSRLRG